VLSTPRGTSVGSEQTGVALTYATEAALGLVVIMKAFLAK
jgi:hypothetical protein